MKFLVDAQLPMKLALQLAASGHDVVHTNELPNGNRTSDSDVISIADVQERVVVTKDRDFRNSHLLRSKPQRLLIVETGNITNQDLLALFDKFLPEVVESLEDAAFVELHFDRLVVRNH